MRAVSLSAAAERACMPPKEAGWDVAAASRVAESLGGGMRTGPLSLAAAQQAAGEDVQQQDGEGDQRRAGPGQPDPVLEGRAGIGIDGDRQARHWPAEVGGPGIVAKADEEQ